MQYTHTVMETKRPSGTKGLVLDTVMIIVPKNIACYVQI